MTDKNSLGMSTARQVHHNTSSQHQCTHTGQLKHLKHMHIFAAVHHSPHKFMYCTQHSTQLNRHHWLSLLELPTKSNNVHAVLPGSLGTSRNKLLYLYIDKYILHKFTGYSPLDIDNSKVCPLTDGRTPYCYGTLRGSSHLHVTN